MTTPATPAPARAAATTPTTWSTTRSLSSPSAAAPGWGDDLTAITLLASLIDQAERCLPELVTNARLNGHTWDQIARALATSPDEARLRFDPRIPGRRPAMALRHLARKPATLNPRKPK
jgi:hypothetical protein